MNLRAFVVSAIAALVMVQAEVTYIDHDKVQPFAQPKPTTDSDKAAVKYKPHLLVSYGCHPYPAVQADGSVSAGLKGSGPVDGECQGSALGSQYLPKGQSGRYQRRHFWETAVVWIDDPSLSNSTILGVSMNYGWRRRVTKAPVEGQFLDDSRVKLESYRGYTTPRPKLQFTTQAGETQDLITWEQLTVEAREALSNADFNTALLERTRREMPMKDGVFEKRLEDAWPF